MGLQDIRAGLRRTYDRVLALALSLLALVCLLALIFYTPRLREQQAAFERRVQTLQPEHPQAQPPDKRSFEEGYARLRAPFQVDAWTNRVLVPELRVRCVNCERPIPYAALVCPYCRAEQPAVVERDVDRDRLPDEWEEKYGLNPRDADDARADADGDGFTNLEEYQSGTDPRDPKSRPPPLGKVRLVEIKPIPFALRFMAVNRVSVEKRLFQINLRHGERTYWKELGEEVEGFKLAEFDETGKDGKPILTLQRGEKLIRLIKGEVVPYNEYDVVLFSGLDNRTFTVRAGGNFELQGVRYEVKSVDTAARRVLIADPVTNTNVWKSSQSSEPSADGGS